VCLSVCVYACLDNNFLSSVTFDLDILRVGYTMTLSASLSEIKVIGQSSRSHELVSWSLMSLFSTNMAISETTRSHDKSFFFG